MHVCIYISIHKTKIEKSMDPLDNGNLPHKIRLLSGPCACRLDGYLRLVTDRSILGRPAIQATYPQTQVEPSCKLRPFSLFGFQQWAVTNNLAVDDAKFRSLYHGTPISSGLRSGTVKISVSHAFWTQQLVLPILMVLGNGNGPQFFPSMMLDRIQRPLSRADECRTPLLERAHDWQVRVHSTSWPWTTPPLLPGILWG